LVQYILDYLAGIACQSLLFIIQTSVAAVIVPHAWIPSKIHVLHEVF